MVVFRNGRVCLRVMDDATLGGYLLPVPNASLHSALSPFSRLCLMHGRCGPCTLLAGEGGLLLSIVQYLNRGGGGGSVRGGVIVLAVQMAKEMILFIRYKSHALLYSVQF